eukprot:13293985-Alexandrium_andersonii.AAC.1
MSASLVGSEMCIRDRLLGRHLLKKREGGRAGLRSMPYADTAGLRSMPQAVSYTHLTLPTICSV